MTDYDVTVLLNADRDGFFGYRPSHPVAQLTCSDGAVLTFRIAADSAREAAERMYPVGNKVRADDSGTSYPADVRSVSVGDMLCVRSGRDVTFYACAPVGWTEVPEPPNRVTPLAGNDRLTSRGTA